MGFERERRRLRPEVRGGLVSDAVVHRQRGDPEGLPSFRGNAGGGGDRVLVRSEAERPSKRACLAVEFLDGDRSGHFGIAGVRDRAERIGARLSFRRAADGWTEVLLVVPGVVVVEGPLKT